MVKLCCFILPAQAPNGIILQLMQVQDKGSWFQNHDDVPCDRKNVILPSMFPSNNSIQEGQSVCDDIEVNTGSNGSFSRNFSIEKTNKVYCDTDGISNSNTTKHSDSTPNSTSSNFPLHRCMRIVPHDQDSGAFFIAVLHKLSPLHGNILFSYFPTSLFQTFHEHLHTYILI